MSASQFASIFDVESGEDTITIRGRTYQLQAIGSKDALILRKRFKDFKQNIDNLQFLVEDDAATDEDLTDEVIARLVRVTEFTNAMVAIALGHAGDEKAEARIDSRFDEQEKAAIIAKAQSLSLGTPDEGFSTRSA